MNLEVDIGQIRECLMEESRGTFGRQYRLEVAAVVSALPPPIWSRRVAGVLQIPENQVASEMAQFVKRGALQEFPNRYDRRKTYEVLDHPLWGFAREVLEQTVLRRYGAEGQQALDVYWSVVCEGEPPQSLPRGSAER